MGTIISRLWNDFKFSENPTLKRKVLKIRDFLVKFFYLILFCLIFVLVFLLGRITKFMEAHPVFTYEFKQSEEEFLEKEKNNLFNGFSMNISTSTIVASKGGKKYYFIWCKGAENIKVSNKRYFNTEESAQKAGYVLANNCR